MRVQLVLAHPLDCAVRDHLVAGMRQRLGAAVQVIVEQVAAIAPEASGKFRYVVSRVDARAGSGSGTAP